ncbi:MAG: hypothetical protein IT378_04790 [Sandaracinaceae bacterium]|nr:hypothetical protein [Sandaracinaceae bacterium]
MAHDVRHIVIGGLAGIAQGAGWPTYDADVVIETEDDNYARVVAALDELQAVYDTPHQPPIRPDLGRMRSLTGPQLFRTRHGRLDVLCFPAPSSARCFARGANRDIRRGASCGGGIRFARSS